MPDLNELLKYLWPLLAFLALWYFTKRGMAIPEWLRNLLQPPPPPMPPVPEFLKDPEKVAALDQFTDLLAQEYRKGLDLIPKQFEAAFLNRSKK